MPGWNDPVATGRREPILRDAFWPSSERICGFWMSLVSVSPMTTDKLADGIVTWKLLAFRVAISLRLSPVEVPVVTVPVVPEPVVPVVVVVGVMLLCSCTVALVGGFRPRVRDLSLLTCITAISTITS